MAVYWVGQDNNIWYKGDDGKTVNRGGADDLFTGGKLLDTGVSGHRSGSFAANRIDDPNPQRPAANDGQAPGSAYSSGGGSSAPAVDAATVAAINNQIGRTQNLLGGMDGRQNTALSNLLGQFNNQNARLQTQRDDSQSDFNRNTKRVTSDNIRKKAQIGDNVRQNVSSLQRLLGAKGAGSSSAANIMAPYAAARAGTSEREEAGQVYSDNMDSLNTEWNRFDRDWRQKRGDLKDQYEGSRRDTESGFAQQKQNLYSKLEELNAELAKARGGQATGAIGMYGSAIDQLQAQIDALAGRSLSPVAQAKSFQAGQMAAQDGTLRGVQASDDPTYDETRYYYPVREEEEELRNLYA